MSEVADLFITEELSRRPAATADHLREKLAIQDLALQMAEHPADVLPRLVSLAMEMCQAASAGLSLYEPLEGTPGVFRWHHLVGVLERFSGATTPREFSPCGVCLDRGQPTLSRHPERFYNWIADAGIVVPEVLLVPLWAGRGESLGTLWIIAHPDQKFDSGHARITSELAAFAGLAFRMVESEKHLTLALDQQRSISEEMSHRVKNIFAIAGGLVVASARSAETPKEMSKVLTDRLNALARSHAIVRQTFAFGEDVRAGDMMELVRTVLAPYDNGSSVKVSGEPVKLSERAVNAFALTLHELATNAVKYGALSGEQGVVTVDWRSAGDDIVVTWTETGGPGIASVPIRQGFGSEITRAGVAQLGGTFQQDWRPEGLRVVIKLPRSGLS